MRVEPERGKAKAQDGYPKIEQMWLPYGERNVEKHDQDPHSKVDTWTSKAREENIEMDSRRCKSATRCNVASTTKSQVVKNRMSVDLC